MKFDTQFYKKRFKQNLKASAALIFCIFVLQTFFWRFYQVEGHSMNPSLEHKQNVFVSKLYYRIFDPKQSDVVIVEVGGESVIKRIIASPEAELACSNGVLVVNGVNYKDNFGEVYYHKGPPVKLKQNQYYLAGDNRKQTENYIIDRKQIKAKVIF